MHTLQKSLQSQISLPTSMGRAHPTTIIQNNITINMNRSYAGGVLNFTNDEPAQSVGDEVFQFAGEEQVEEVKEEKKIKKDKIVVQAKGQKKFLKKD